MNRWIYRGLAHKIDLVGDLVGIDLAGMDYLL